MMERAGHRHEALQRNEGSSVRLEEPGHQPSISLPGILAAKAQVLPVRVSIGPPLTVVPLPLIVALFAPLCTFFRSQGSCAAIGLPACSLVFHD